MHYCFICKKPNYNSEPLFVNKKNGSIFEFRLIKQGKYSFELHQSEREGSAYLEEEDLEDEGPCRSTMLLIRRSQ